MKRAKATTHRSKIDRKLKRDALFWHPLVHRQFGEELYFFLISSKPFDEPVCFNDIERLAATFGVTRYCAYQVFGQFDVLVRVWLPVGLLQQFIDRAIDIVVNIKSILPLNVTSISDPWRFPPTLAEETQAVLANLDSKAIEDVQSDRQESLRAEYLKRSLLTLVPDFRTTSDNAVKSFIGLSDPNSHDLGRKKAIFDELQSLVREQFSFGQPTIYRGIGFCWILIKLVSVDFYQVGRLVEAVARKFKGDGISTMTFLVASVNYVEGECIGKRALELRSGDEDIRLVLPELYTSTDLPSGLKDGIATFVRDVIIRTPIDSKDKLAIQSFLRAVINGSYIDAYTALFPRFIQSESELRDRIIKYIVATEGDKGLTNLVNHLDPERKFIKSIKTIPLAYVLKACNATFIKLGEPSNLRIEDKLNDATFESVASVRNKLMHGASFDCETEWKTYAAAAVDLALLRDFFVKSIPIQTI